MSGLYIYCICDDEYGYYIGLIGLVPLQLSKFGVMPLQFVYSETCHYNFHSTGLMPFSTPEHMPGPVSGRRIRYGKSYGRFCPWLQRIRASRAGTDRALSSSRTRPSSSIHVRRRRRLPSFFSGAGRYATMRDAGSLFGGSSGSGSASAVSGSQGNQLRLVDCPHCGCRVICI